MGYRKFIRWSKKFRKVTIGDLVDKVDDIRIVLSWAKVYVTITDLPFWKRKKEWERIVKNSFICEDVELLQEKLCIK